MLISSVMGFVWTPLLVKALGDSVYGTFLSFQSALRLGGLGDFGLSGAVAVRTGQMMGRGETDTLRHFLSSARTALAAVALIIALMFCVLAPWLPGWLKFEASPHTGSLMLLFMVGGLTIFTGLMLGYYNSVNLAYATVTWPILPALFLTQGALFAHWMLARLGFPLWVQALAPLLGLALNVLVLRWMLNVAHPWLGKFFPLGFDRVVWRGLLMTSGWVYLYSIGNVVFSETDRLLVQAGFGAATVPAYRFNFKLCEVALAFIAAASFASAGKINMWIANPSEESQQRSREAVHRLSLFQSTLGTAAALGYLSVNNNFVELWVGEQYRIADLIQWAFALTLAITSGGDAALQISGLCGPKGIRTAGIAIGVAALINLALSFLAMLNRSLAGLAYATVFAQSLLSIYLGIHTARYLQMPVRAWLIRSWLLPVCTVASFALVQSKVGSDRWGKSALLLGVGAILLIIHSRMAGVTQDFLRHEWQVLRRMTRRN